MTSLQLHAERTTVGSRVLARRAVRAFLDCPPRERVYRVLGALFGGWMLGGMVLATREILWALAAAFLVAAWQTGRGVERREAARTALVQYLRDQIGDRNGVLLAQVLTGLHAAGMHTDWDVTVLRGVVEQQLGVLVRDSLKVDGAVSVGVHVDDLTDVWDVQPTPPPTPSGNPSPGAVTSDNYPTTPETPQPTEGVAWSPHASGQPAPAAPGPDAEEAERQRLQDLVNRVYAAREEAFEEHLTDALGLLQEEVNEA